MKNDNDNQIGLSGEVLLNFFLTNLEFDNETRFCAGKVQSFEIWTSSSRVRFCFGIKFRALLHSFFRRHIFLFFSVIGESEAVQRKIKLLEQ